MIYQPQIITSPPRKLIGTRIQTSLSENKTRELWQQFRPRIPEIKSRINDDFYSVEQYPAGFNMAFFTPATRFEKWAAVEVSDFENVPEGLEMLALPGGLYARFIYVGLPTGFKIAAQYFYGTWLPQSGYELDGRPHFEIMGANYRPDDPAAEEEIWIPVCRREKLKKTDDF